MTAVEVGAAGGGGGALPRRSVIEVLSCSLKTIRSATMRIFCNWVIVGRWLGTCAIHQAIVMRKFIS